MADIDTNTLLSETKCYACLNLTLAQLLKLGLLKRWLLSLDPTADTSVATLLDAAKCYACYGASLSELLELGLLNSIDQAS